jgi:hypothetical protein
MLRDVSASLSASLRPLEAREMSALTLQRPALDSMSADVSARSAFGGHATEIARSFPSFSMDAGAPERGPVFGGGSPSLQDQVTFLNGLATDGNVAATSYWTWDRDIPAGFLDTSRGAKWGPDHATTDEVVTVDYFFLSKSNWDATEKGVFDSCLALWSAITNVRFNEVTDRADADLLLKRYEFGSAFSWNTTTASNPEAGDVGQNTVLQKDQNMIAIDTDVPGFGPIDGNFERFGGYVWSTIVHELGHALGLGHAGPYNGFVNTDTQQFSAYDTLAWSVMSYIEPHQDAKYQDEYTVHTDWGLSPEGYTLVPTTMMALDILAVQALYGTPLSTPLNGGQTFGFNCDVGGALQPFFDFTLNKNPVITLWSAGTDNTLDLSGYRTDSDVNLNPGAFSSCDGRKNNICIAFNTLFETAIGGKGNDKFTGNDLANTLLGDLGNDIMRGGLGADAMTGGRGNDTYKYGGVAESTSTGYDTITGFDFGSADVFNFNGTVEGVDAAVQFGTLSEGSFDADLEAALGGLGGHHAILFRPDEGDLHGQVFIVVDANDLAGYQAGEDFVMLLDGVKHRGDIDLVDFT